MSFTWRAGQVTSAALTFNSYHPWLAGQKENSARPGFFRSKVPSGQMMGEVAHGTMRNSNSSGTAGRALNTGGYRSAFVTLSSPNGLRMYLPSTPLSVPDPLSHPAPAPAPLPRCVLSAEPGPSIRYSRTERRGGSGAEGGEGPGDDVSSHWIEGISLSPLFLSFLC